jgi:hypothetical protein
MKKVLTFLIGLTQAAVNLPDLDAGATDHSGQGRPVEPISHEPGSTHSEVDGNEYDDHMFDEWEELMSDFHPDLLVTVPVGARSDEFFYEDVSAPGALIRGAFFVVDSEVESESSGVDFVVTDPDGSVVYTRSDNVEGVFSVKTEKKGTYTIMLSNHRWVSKKQVTVLIGVGESKTLKSDDLSDLTAQFESVENKLKEIGSESNYLWMKNKNHLNLNLNLNNKIYYFYFSQFLIFLIISTIQIFYIKSLIHNRRLF